ncbi:succinylglutamate desuccinylase/aspartoacylase family protein [Cochlodiniinecator piscidefendens]|uniref:succinylglutamate desuccinylase/aspartoacylase family protein n=1 Tax=Cochlodiniinecator piscidefendens TaxID=2715756 RepID=UPI00140D4A6B|nr:succinylglutamate desuccinylase/aspartoacylase family protein [Cochlodiniinecator piscidefendens]
MHLTLDLDAIGTHHGDAMLRWSDNSNPLGYHPIPVISIKGRAGPTLLITAGTHGDEFEGPSAAMRIARSIDPEHLNGQLIILPALNAPAVRASSRVTPLDGANLNRAFPGHPQGGPTAMIADFIEAQIMPRVDAAIDLHSGGKASFFQPCTLPTRTKDPELYEKNLDLAVAFGLPLIWRLGANNDARSVNSAAERTGVPMVATELGGGGGVDPEITNQTETGLRRLMVHLGMIDGEAPSKQTKKMVEVTDPLNSLYAPAEGLFDRAVKAGQTVKAGDFAGWFHFPLESERPPLRLTCPTDGFILAHTNRGYVQRGEMLALVTSDISDDLN